MERAEKIGLGIASAAHVLLVALLSATLMRAPKPLKLNNPPIDVSIVDEVALKSAAPKVSTEPPPPTQAPEIGPEQQAAPAPMPEPTPAPPPPKPVAKPTPKPEPAPKVRPVEKAKPVPKVVAPAPPPKKAAPTKKPEPTKASPAKTAPAKVPTKTSTSTAKDTPKDKAIASRGSRLGPDFLKGIQTESSSVPAKPAAGAPAAVIGPAQKAALDAEIRRQLKPYWKSPTGADVEQLRTFVQVDLAKDGSIVGTPEVVDTTGITPSNQGQVRLHREQAVKAIKLAAPLRLPPDLYAGWKSLRISFDKRLSQ